MSTELHANDGDGFYITRFFGGTERGTCIQVTKDQAYVQLTVDECRVLEEKLGDYLDTIPVRVIECGCTDRQHETTNDCPNPIED